MAAHEHEPNPAQAEAIAHPGPLFVAAGAGSGKTYVLTRRAARLMLEDGGGPGALDRVLVITFTEKAAGEILERVRRELMRAGDLEAARAAGAGWVSTIHGFCLRVLRRHALEAGLSPDFRVAGEDEADAMRRDAFESAAREALEDDAGAERFFEELGLDRAGPALLRSLEAVRAMGLEPGDVRLPSDPATAANARAFADLLSRYACRYAEKKAALAVVDYEDMQLMTARLFEERPEIAALYSSHFREVMVDEFQDTNALQMRAVGQVCDGGLCTVGDERQAIYGFRHADVGVFRALREDAAEGGAHVSALTVNYRSHPEILRFVDALFSSERLFGDDFLRLEPGRDGGWAVPWPDDAPRVEVLVSDRDAGSCWREAEAEALADRLLALAEQGVAPGDIAVLMRYGTYAHLYADALRRRGLPVAVATGEPFFGRPEVADLGAILRVMANPLDDEALLRVLAGRAGGLSDDALLALRREAGARPIWKVLGEPAACGLEGLDAAQAGRVRRVVSEARRSARAGGSAQALAAAVEGLDYDLAVLTAEDGRVAYASVLKMLRMAARYERDGAGGPLGFLAWLRRREAAGAREKGADAGAEGVEAIRIMTVHAAKGLEFPVVAVADMGHGAPREGDPFSVSRDQDGRPALRMKTPGENGKLTKGAEYERLQAVVDARDREEEQRLLYVACTRAEEALILAGSASLAKGADEPTAMGWVLRELPDGWPDGGTVLLGDSTVSVSVAPALEEPPSAPARERPERPETPPDLAPAGRDEPTSAQPPRAVSYTSLKVHSQCPRRYELERTLGLRSFRPPAGAGPRELGDAVHAVLQVAGPPGPADERRLEAAARRHGLEAEAGRRLSEAANAYLGSELAARLHSHEDVRKEAPFSVRIGTSLLTGKMDAVGRSGGRWLVVDYKTGKGRDDPEAYRMQADCYALAALEAGGEEVEVVFAEVETGSVHSFAYTPADRDGIRAWIERAVGSMSAERQPDRGAFDNDVCGNCPALPGMCSVRR